MRALFQHSRRSLALRGSRLRIADLRPIFSDSRSDKDHRAEQPARVIHLFHLFCFNNFVADSAVDGHWDGRARFGNSPLHHSLAAPGRVQILSAL